MTNLTMEKFTVEDFQKHFDELMERVEDGESFLITSDYGNAILTPYEGNIRINEEIDYFCDHDDAC